MKYLTFVLLNTTSTQQFIEIYALSDFKYMQDHNALSERMDSDKEKRYLEGRYGAITMLGSFNAQMEALYGKKR